jgi:hypothetical protein
VRKCRSVEVEEDVSRRAGIENLKMRRSMASS